MPAFALDQNSQPLIEELLRGYFISDRKIDPLAQTELQNQSLRQLITAKPKEEVEELMEKCV